MSSLVLYKNFTFGASQASTYSDSSKTHDLSLNYHIKNIGIDTYVHMSARNNTTGVYFFNQTYKNQVFPNGTAPLKRFEWNVRNVGSLGTTTNYAWHFKNTRTGVDQEVSVWSHTSKIGAYGGDHSGSKDITNGLTRDACELQLHCTSGGSVEGLKTLSFYFTRYDFAAAAGTGIASATANNSTQTVYGYDGDTITFVATAASGYRFDHWSDGSTDNPHTITVNGADKTLTAYGASSGKNLSVLYGNSLTVNETVTGNATVAIGQALGSLPFTLSDGAKTLNCKGKYMQNNVTVGARNLKCKDHTAPYNIPVLLCPGSWATNTALNNATSGTAAASGWITTPLLKLPAGCTNITIECGGTHSGYSCLHELDANGGYLSYWGAASDPRTFTFDYPSSIVYVRATFNMANFANCYIKDNTHNVYVFRGGNV